MIVDPSFDFNRASTAINDAVLYSSTSARNQKHGSNWDHYIGYYNSTYGVGRLLVKFPGLTNSRVFQSLDKSQITGATFYAWQYRDTSVSTSVQAYLYNGTAWDEQDIRCTTASWNGYASVDGMNGISVTGRAWYGFNIKPAVLKWKDGTHDPAKGLMIRNANESNSSCFKVFNSTEWGSSQNSSQMPYVTLSWNANTPSGISNNGVYYFQNVCSGKYLDVYNADTANNTNLIQFGLTWNANQKFKLERDSSGYYRILAQHTSLKRVLLLNTSNQVVLSDDCSSERALWRIKDEGSGQYSFINKADETTSTYAMSNMGSGSSGAQIKGESYTNATRLRWRLKKAVIGVTITPSAATVSVGNTLVLNYSVTPSDAYIDNVSWSSNKTSVITINSSSGLVTGIAPGTATITCVVNGVSGSREMIIEPEAVKETHLFKFDYALSDIMTTCYYDNLTVVHLNNGNAYASITGRNSYGLGLIDSQVINALNTLNDAYIAGNRETVTVETRRGYMIVQALLEDNPQLVVGTIDYYAAWLMAVDFYHHFSNGVKKDGIQILNFVINAAMILYPYYASYIDDAFGSVNVNSKRIVKNTEIVASQQSTSALNHSLRNVGYSSKTTISASTLNAEWATRGYTNPPPVLPGTQAYRIVTTSTTRFVRVSATYSSSGQAGQFLMKLDDYVGLTAQQLKSKYALSFTPKYAYYADIPAGTTLNCSIANEWGSLFGRGVQYDLNGAYTGVFTFFETIT